MSQLNILNFPFRAIKNRSILIVLSGIVIGMLLLKSWVLGVGLLGLAVVVCLAMRSALVVWILLMFNMLFISNYTYPPVSTILFWGLTGIFILSVFWYRFYLGKDIVWGDSYFWMALISWYIWGIVTALLSPDLTLSIKEMLRYGIMIGILFAYIQWFADKMSLRLVLRGLWVSLCLYALLITAKNFFPGHRAGFLLGDHWHSQPESAGYFATFIPLFLSLIKRMRGRIWKTGLWILVFFGVIVASSSTAAVIASIVGVMALFAFALPKISGRIAIFGLMASIAIFILGSMYLKGFNEMLVYQMSGRERIWPAAVHATESHPLFGVGPGRWSQWFGTHYFATDFIFDDFQGNTFMLNPATLDGQAHNLFLTKSAEMGIPSLILLLAVFGFWFRKSFGVYCCLPDGWRRDLVRGCLATFVGLTFFCFFENGPIIGTAREGEIVFVTMILAMPFAVGSSYKKLWEVDV
ncbi:MAG: O-antigen ligase family protein [Candidatus Omnitrophica bacterium]|nr:O-antigen ligase family protein [Candidatus Omnitrophota bacterium]